MALDKGLPTGRTVGDVYAWGAAGSIVGTFIAGYWLIPAMGTIAIVWTVGSILLLMAILFCIRHCPFLIWAAIFLSAMAAGTTRIHGFRTAGGALALREAPDPQVIYHDETPYCYLSVKRLSEQPDERVFVQDKLVHSKIVMDDITNLQYFYTEIYAALMHELCAPQERVAVMVIGGGGYVFPRYVEKMWPESTIEVVEIDPGVTKAAIEAFGLKRDTMIKTLTRDARNYVDELLYRQRTGTTTLYDFIYGDACNDYCIPYQLVTKEFNDKILRILAPEGVYMLTIIDTYDSGKFLGAVVNTFQETFPNTYVFVEGRMPKWARNTFVVVGTRQELDIQNIISKYQKKTGLWCLSSVDVNKLKEKSSGLILTDNYAPAENLLAPVVCQAAQEMLAYEHMNRAEKLASSGKLEESIASYKKAAQAKPQLTVEANNRIGLICIQMEDYARAVEMFKEALYQDEQIKYRNDVADIELNLSVALEKSGQEKEAGEYAMKSASAFRTQLLKDPNSISAHIGLGNALLMLGEFEPALKAFETVVLLNPDDITTAVSFVQVLEQRQRYDEATALLQVIMGSFQTKEQNNTFLTPLQEYLEVLESKKAGVNGNQ